MGDWTRVSELVPASGFVSCEWSCEKCQQRGLIAPWRRQGEDDQAAAARHTMETRARCIEGCLEQTVVRTKKRG